VICGNLKRRDEWQSEINRFYFVFGKFFFGDFQASSGCKLSQNLSFNTFNKIKTFFDVSCVFQLLLLEVCSNLLHQLPMIFIIKLSKVFQVLVFGLKPFSIFRSFDNDFSL
jgi:hypothetical protein